MLWILRLVASAGLLGLVSQWPTTPQAAVALALAACVVGATLALAVAGTWALRSLPTSGLPTSGLRGHALPTSR